MQHSEPFFDQRDQQEYRTIITSWGQRWLADNLNYCLTGSSDSKYPEDGKRGQIYSYPLAQQALPDNWRIPTRQEWAKLWREFDSNLFEMYLPDETVFGGECVFWTSSNNLRWMGRGEENHKVSAKIINSSEFILAFWEQDRPIALRCVQD